jgi:hypothetical protein
VNTRTYLQWYARGAADARDHEPRRYAPRLPEDQLYGVLDCSPPGTPPAGVTMAPEARAYWDGFDGHLSDVMARIGRENRAA